MKTHKVRAAISAHNHIWIAVPKKVWKHSWGVAKMRGKGPGEVSIVNPFAFDNGAVMSTKATSYITIILYGTKPGI